MFGRIKKATTFTFSTIRSMPRLEIRLLGVVIFTMASAGINIALAYLFSQSATTLSLATIDINTLLYAAGGAVLLIAAEPFAQNLQSKLLVPIRTYMSSDISNKIPKKVYDLSLDYKNSNPGGKLTQFISQTYFSVEKIIPSIFGKIIPVSLEILVLTGAAIGFCGPVALALPTLFIVYVGTSFVGGKKIDSLHSKQYDKTYEIYRHIHGLFSKYENVHYFGNQDHELRNFKQAERTLGESIEDTFQATENYSLLQIVILSVGLSSIIVLFGNEIFIQKTLSMTALPFIGIYLYRLPMILTKLPPAITDLQIAAVSLEKITEFINTESDIVEAPYAASLLVTPQTASIEFKNVSFKYKNIPIFDNVSFSILPGQLYAITGASGVGKSSILKILLRFVEIESGDVFINGQNIRSVSLKSLRKAFAVVPQTPILENISIEDNVRYGNFKASNASTHLNMAIAGLETLDPNKLCGEGGNQLSGGQKQRVAIARALIKDSAAVLFYDEATSGLDPSSEKEIQDKLDEISIGRTTLTITHHLRTVVNADQILYFADGKISEQGTYEELMSIPDGKFRQQMLSQSYAMGIELDPIKPKDRMSVLVIATEEANNTPREEVTPHSSRSHSTVFFPKTIPSRTRHNSSDSLTPPYCSLPR